jgi:hypothetical protein
MRDTHVGADCTRRSIKGGIIGYLVKLFIEHRIYHVKVKKSRLPVSVLWEEASQKFVRPALREK